MLAALVLMAEAVVSRLFTFALMLEAEVSILFTLLLMFPVAVSMLVSLVVWESSLVICVSCLVSVAPPLVVVFTDVAHRQTRHICLFAQPINRIDATGADLFAKLVRELSQAHGLSAEEVNRAMLRALAAKP